MRVLLLADRSFGSREHQMLRRIEVGLLDDGVQVVRAMPRSLSDVEGPNLTDVIPYQEVGSRFTLGWRARRLLRDVAVEFGRSDTEPQGLVDVIHVWGVRAWHLGVWLATLTGASLAVESLSRRAVRRAVSFEHDSAKALDRAGVNAAWIASDNATAAALKDAGVSWPMHAAPWGVHPGSGTRTRPAAQPPSVCLVCSGRHPTPIATALDAIADVAEELPNMLLFLDEAAVREHHHIWKRCDQLSLLPRLSVIADMESRRELTLRADLLIHPEPDGQHRSLTLEAMADGMLVSSLEDDLIEAFSDHARACLVPRHASRDDWRDAVRRALRDAEDAERTRRAAREYIAQHRTAAGHIAALGRAYSSLRGEEPIAFPAGAAGAAQSPR